MGIIEILVIAVGVSMDAFAVSICKGLSVRKLRPSYPLTAALWFGGFQALMPLLGYFLGVSFGDLVGTVDHWIAFVLLGIIGGNMIKESFENDEGCNLDADFSFRTMLAMAVATSVDALAVGVSFAFLRVNIWLAVALIGITTALFSGAGIVFGNIFGCRFKSRAELAGGIILVAMGCKILLEHLFL